MKYVLTIDLGTSGPKVAVYTMRGEIVAHTKTPTAVSLFPNGGAEQDPDEWWLAIKTAVSHVLAQDAVPVSDIVAISCTSQWSGTVAVDAQGQPLMPAINWMDSRGEAYVRQITGGSVNVVGYGLDKMLTWLRLTGGIPTLSGKDPIAHILYIKNELPEIYAKTYKFLEPKDYLNLHLTGKFAATYDSITLHWVTDNRDLTAVTYNDKLLKLAGVERDKLPDLIRATDVVGFIRPEIAAELGLETAVQVVGGTPDVHSAAIGSGAVADYEAHLSIGTSSWIIGHVPFKKTDIFHNMASLPSAIPERYLLINEQESAGACLTYLIDQIFYPDDKLAVGTRPQDVYQRLNEAAATVPAGSDGLIFTPWLYGERTPVEDHAIRGGFFNLSLTMTRAHMVRAVFEGVAYNSKWLLGYVEKFMKRPLSELRVIGGGAQSALWCQIMADVLDRTIHQVENPMQANTRGVALLAAVALGHLNVADIGGTVHIANTYTPNAAHRQTYDDQFQTFLQLYKQHSKLLRKQLHREH
ncbi:MAG: FGGY-family carbohydrate kinase [Anaerolineae bacterium]|nr:FGGY-family carbohydrate kinase [Anaerolineae bacterium]